MGGRLKLTWTTHGIIALSGGVDSAVAAAICSDEKARPTGIFIRHRYQPTIAPQDALRLFDSDHAPEVFDFAPDGKLRHERWTPERFSLPADCAAAVRVALYLKMPFAIFDADTVFSLVTDDFIKNYLAAETPNPCVLCNRILKFGALVRLAKTLNADYFATGHYVSAVPADDWLAKCESTAPVPDFLQQQSQNQVALLRSPFGKDQSYVLWNIDRNVLPFLRFPLGTWRKEQVRIDAAARALPVVDKPESQDLCFIPNGSHGDFIRQFGDGRPTDGEFVSLDGKALGRHAGYEKYTVGQRKGLGIGFGERTFVQRIDALSRSVILGPYESLARTKIRAKNANWLLDVPFEEPFRCEVKVRYRNRPVAASVTALADGTIHALLDEPRFGIAPGQSLVCYWQDRLLGGGIIEPEKS